MDTPSRSRIPTAWLVALGVGPLIVLLAWRTFAEIPEASLDQSWHAALSMAAHDTRLQWGTDLVFTYGPFGWLRSHRDWYSDTSGYAFLYYLATHSALASCLWLRLRRPFGSLIAALLLLPLMWAIDDATTALAFAAAIVLLEITADNRRALLLAAGLGALGSFELLGKINAGVTILVAGALAAALSGPRLLVTRRFGAWTLGAVIGLPLFWLLAGQSLGHIPDYLHNAARVVSGYSQSMGYDEPAQRWTLWLAIGFTGLGLAAIRSQMAPELARRRTAVAVLWLAWCFMYFKAGFVRQDSGHTFLFFAAAGPALAAIRWRRSWRTAGLVLLAPACFLWVNGAPASRMIDPVAHLDSAREQLPALWRPGRRQLMERIGRERSIASYPIDPAVIDAIGRHSVTVEPYLTYVVWAYRMRWNPLPVFQDYQAYTHGLDALNAAKLLGDDAPERVLYNTTPDIDGRLPSFDTPATARARLCRYTPMVARGDWLVLARGANRCTVPELVGSVRTAWGEPMPVPAPRSADAVVMVRIAGGGVQGAERLRSLLYRSYERRVAMEPGGRVQRVMPGTLGSGLPLRAGSRADLPAPFNVAPGAESIALQRSGGQPGGRPLRFDFYEFRVTGGVQPPR